MRSLSLENINPMNSKHVDLESGGELLDSSEDSEDISQPITKQEYLNEHPFQLFMCCYTHCLFVMVFEIFFYFNYVAPYEVTSIYNLIDSLIREMLDIADKYEYEIPDDSFDYIDEMCDSKITYDERDSYNDQLFIKCLYGITFGIVGLIILMSIEIGFLKLKTSMFRNLIHSILSMALIGIFDYFLFIYIIAEYKLLSQGEMACHIHDSYENGDYD